MTSPAEHAATVREELLALAESLGTPRAIATKLRALAVRADELERERDEWMTPFDGSGTEWHERLPNPYTYQASDFSKLVAAVHEYDARADAFARQLLADAKDALAKYVSLYYRHDERLVSEYRVLLARIEELGGKA